MEWSWWKLTTGCPTCSWLGWLEFWVYSIAAQFCLGWSKFGRSGWADGQDGGTPKSKSTQPRSMSRLDTLAYPVQLSLKSANIWWALCPNLHLAIQQNLIWECRWLCLGWIRPRKMRIFITCYKTSHWPSCHRFTVEELWFRDWNRKRIFTIFQEFITLILIPIPSKIDFSTVLELIPGTLQPAYSFHG